MDYRRARADDAFAESGYVEVPTQQDGRLIHEFHRGPAAGHAAAS